MADKNGNADKKYMTTRFGSMKWPIHNMKKEPVACGMGVVAL